MSETATNRRNLEERLEKMEFSSSRYELNEIIGWGCFGVVYKAYDNELEKDVAIKMIAPDETGLRLLEKRGINFEAAIKKESMELKACANVVPRKFERDDINFIFSNFILESKIS